AGCWLESSSVSRLACWGMGRVAWERLNSSCSAVSGSSLPCRLISGLFAAPGAPPRSRSAQDLPHRRDERVGIRVGADTDAQIVAHFRGFEPPHEDPGRTQFFPPTFRGKSRRPHEDEIRGTGKHLELQLAQAVAQSLARL